MDKTLLPMARQDRPTANVQWELPAQALERWEPRLMAAAATENSISIFDPIGVDPWTGEGVTAKRISSALRSIGPDQDITVNINSPGGDLFEGFAIYNLLRDYKGKITVKVLGVAASAASVVAMAGDDIEIARAGFLMIHDTWVVVMGNANDLRAVADELEPFDAAMADIYAARSGQSVKTIRKWMDAETWINGAQAVEQGFADSLLAADEVKQDPNVKAEYAAAYRINAALAKAGMQRSERQALLRDFRSGNEDTSFGRAAANAQLSQETQMSDATNGAAPKQPAVITQSQLDAARAEGVAEGKAAAKTDAEAAKHETEANVAKAATERIKAITQCDAAKTRPELAAHLAFDEPSMSAERAQALLAKAAPEAKPAVNPLANAMPPNPKVGADGEPRSLTEGVSALETSDDIFNRRRGQMHSVKK